jgi:hypothetical protein
VGHDPQVSVLYNPLDFRGLTLEGD